tara:strand:- start:1279 stop:1380 length:102 start_codon:yes stop_codon:yes gene_type:complete
MPEILIVIIPNNPVAGKWGGNGSVSLLLHCLSI